MNESSKANLSPYRWVVLGIVQGSIFTCLAAQFQIAALAYKLI